MQQILVFMVMEFICLQIQNMLKVMVEVRNNFFVALSINGRQFPAIYPRDRGINLIDGYDTHYSADSFNEVSGLPNEWVYFEPSQLLLCYQISLNEVGHVVPILNVVIDYLVTKCALLNRKHSRKKSKQKQVKTIRHVMRQNEIDVKYDEK
eukprot:752937_1